MPRKLIVEVAADMTQLLKGLRAGEQATQRFAKEVTVDSGAMAQAQVDAALKTTAALEKEAAAYRAIAHTAEKGSKEQVTAARLAESAERKLAASYAHTGHAASSAAASAKHLERATSHAARGALSGSGLFHSFGRSLAFATGGFIAFHEGSQFVRESVDAARDAVVAQQSLAAQMKASGESFSANREQIERTALSYGKFGFQNDEVIASLTVLERGTGSIARAQQLQGLAADLARARNLRLAAAAGVIAKVFGGQETALRRAVPGLAKHAHGMDLIRLAQAKLAGQAAANTTAAERFQATLHDTQEIIGGALLPTLDRFLDSLGKWLDSMNRSGRLQRDVARASAFLSDAISVLKTVLGPVAMAWESLTLIVGGTKNALMAIAAAFAAFKFPALVGWIVKTAEAVGLIGTTAEASAAKVEILRFMFLGPGGLIAAAGVGLLYMQRSAQKAAEAAQEAAGATFAKGSGLETTLVPRLAKEIAAMKAAGKTGSEIITKLKSELSDSSQSLKADDLIGEAFAFSNRNDPALAKRIQAAVKAKVDALKKTTDDAIAKSAKAGPSVEQRHNWFDDRIQRALGAVTDTASGAEASLPTQLTRLNAVEASLRTQIAKVKDVTRRHKLEDQLQGVINDEFRARQGIADKLKQAATDAAEKMKQAAAEAKQKQDEANQSILDALSFNVEKAGVTKTVNDDIAALRNLNAQIDKQIKQQGATTDLLRQRFQNNQEIAQKQQEGRQQQQEARQSRLEGRNRRQFELLGLTGEGEQRTQGLDTLRDRYASFGRRLQASGLLTGTRATVFTQIGRALANGVKNGMGKPVRAAIEQVFDDWHQLISGDKGKGIASRYAPASTSSIMRSLGFDLNPGEAKRLSVVLAQLGPHGTVAPGRSPAFARAGLGGITVHGGLHLHGIQDIAKVEQEITKRAASRSQPRRGAR